MARIRQFVSLPPVEKCIGEKFKLWWCNRHDQPVIFFGLFHQEHIDYIARHKALVVIAWVGTDSWCMERSKKFDYGKVLDAPYVRHIATSKWNIDDLSACGIPHVYIPISHTSAEIFKPVKLGPKVYCYSHPKRPVLYGQAIIDEVKERLPDIEFIETKGYQDYPPEKMSELYSECFIGLRPAIHDGVSNTVVELGYMGRRCIHNGFAPNAIHWNTADDIVRSIKKEQKKIGTVNYKLAKKVIEYTNIGDSWLYTEFYKGVK